MELSRYFSEDWYRELKNYIESSDFENIAWKIANERKNRTIYPEKGSDTFLVVLVNVIRS